jgi:hypothetical protein
VNSAAISAALERFDREFSDASEWTDWESNKAFKYAIEHGGKRYPVKEIIALATGASLDSFSGGEGSAQANEYVRRRGFVAVPLRPRNPPWTRDELRIPTRQPRWRWRSGGIRRRGTRSPALWPQPLPTGSGRPSTVHRLCAGGTSDGTRSRVIAR